MKTYIHSLLVICSSLFGIFGIQDSHAQTYQIISSFTNSPANPAGNLVLGPDGNFYGTSYEGGANGSGTIFKIDASNNISVLYSFTGRNDGANPLAGLTVGPDGNLYGTTSAGGPKRFGTIFRMSTNGVFTSLLSFTGNSGAVLGRRPQGAIISATDGNLYGTTTGGGANGLGVIFQLTTNGVFTPLVSFTGANGMGSQPYGGLVQGADGYLYGTTYNGGSNSVGTIFSVTTNGNFTTLFSFGVTNGSNPYIGLTFGPDGNLYGTTYNGGSASAGTVFSFTTNGSLTTLNSFAGDASGGNPRGSLVVGANGVLYGTCTSGGSGQGTLFSITTNGIFTSLYAFNGSPDGGLPYAGLICRAGNLYGLNYSGGVNNQGTFYAYNLAVPGAISLLSSFVSYLPLNPYSSLVPGPNGTFYGTSQNGGISNAGTIYQLSSGGALTVVHSFTGNDGANPFGSLTLAPDGNYYGTTSAGGSNTWGTIFRFATNGTLTSLFSFTNYEASSPESGLTIAPDGLLYGTYWGGGSGVYCIDTNGNYTMLTNFTAAYSILGGGVQAGLTVAPDGNLYGVAPNGGANSWGTVFRVSTNGSVTPVLSFTGLDGVNPGGGSYENLLVGPDGLLYGTSSQGGNNDNGTIYSITTNGIMNVLYYFNGDTNGAYPQSGLILGPGGNFYGATAAAGANSNGTLYMLTTNGILTTLYTFTGGNDGGSPHYHPVLASDGSLYGPAFSGSGGAGVIYRLSVAPAILANPVAQNLVISNTASISVSATNRLFTDQLTYQWYFNGAVILNATNATYSFGPVLTNTSGNYQAVVTGAGGSVTSSVTPVTVWIPSILNFASDLNRQVMTLTLSSAPGSTNRILTTTNLITAMTKWQPFSTNIPGTNGLFQVIDTNDNSPGSLKFYRLSSP